jgi:hypothetical protein
VGQAVKIVHYTAGHYEVQEVEFGTVYAWRPQSVMAECKCGEKLHLTVLEEANCRRCGTDHTAVLQEEEELAGHYSEEEAHPWRYTGHREDAGLPF